MLALKLGQGVQVVHPHRVLEPHRVVGLHRLGDTDGAGQIPHRVHLQGDLHPVAHGVPDLAPGAQPLLDLGPADALPAGLGAELVEGPDLHRRDPLVQEGAGQGPGVRLPGVQVLVRPLGAPVCVGGVDPPGLAVPVAVAGAGVVDAHPLLRGAPQETVHRQPLGLPDHVPEGHVQGREAPHLAAVQAGGGAAAVEGAPVALDGEGVLPQQERGRHLVHEGVDRVRVAPGVAQAHGAGVRVQADEQAVRVLPQAHRLHRRDLHLRHPSAPLASRGQHTNSGRLRSHRIRAAPAQRSVYSLLGEASQGPSRPASQEQTTC